MSKHTSELDDEDFQLLLFALGTAAGEFMREGNHAPL